MKLSLIQRVMPAGRRRWWLAGAGLVAGVVALGLFWRPSSAGRAAEFHPVRRGDFLISVVEGGTVEAVKEELYRSEMEGTARIIYIVPEGTTVKAGDLLVELDSSSSQDAVNQQQINVEKSQFALIQAQQQLDIQKSVVDSEVDSALLRVEFAQTDLEKFQKGEATGQRRDMQIEITNVVVNLGVAEERLQWTERLFAEGYETKSNLDRELNTVSELKLKREQAERKLWMLETFDEPKKKRTLESALKEAKDTLDRTRLQGERRLAQFRADVDSQQRTLELSEKKLERDMKQLAAAKIVAKQGGLVVYAGGGNRFSSESMIEEGAVIRNRQELIKLPDISEMKVQVKIHESHIAQIRQGQKAYVVLDSLPDQRFSGHVSRVAPLPDSQSRWGNPNLKVYATEVVITDPLPNIKPGVSARAEIVVTNLTQVITVPIQAVTTLKGRQVAWKADPLPRPVEVEVGLYNTKFIQVVSGLEEGDRILLAPPFDAQTKDLGGSILAQGDPEAAEAAKAVAVTEPAVATVANGGERAVPAGGDRNRDGTGRSETLREFDRNKDGQLDETERSGLRERFGGGRRRGTNAPPETGTR